MVMGKMVKKGLTKRVVRGGAKSTALARVGDPLVTERGDKIEPEGYVNGKVVKAEAPNLVLDAASFRPNKKRTLRELPAEQSLINGIGAIFMYTMLGVGDREIADALNTTVVRIEDVRKHSAYKECFDVVVAEFINKNSDLLAARIAAYSHSALDTVGSLITTGKKEETRLRASTDLLDRAGVRAKDVAERSSSNRHGELRIIVVDGAKDVNLNIDIDSGESNDIAT